MKKMWPLSNLDKIHGLSLNKYQSDITFYKKIYNKKLSCRKANIRVINTKCIHTWTAMYANAVPIAYIISKQN